MPCGLQLQAQLLGDAPLPWEAAADPSAVLHKIGIFREPLLQLLQREPARRATMQDFCNACNSLVASNTTTGGT